MRRTHPIERGDQHECNTRENGHEEASDETHVVIKWQPRNEDIIAGEVDRADAAPESDSRLAIRAVTKFIRTSFDSAEAKRRSHNVTTDNRLIRRERPPLLKGAR